MTDAERLAALMQLIETWTNNRDDESGDKYLSDAELAMQAAESIALYDSLDGPIRDGWISAPEGYVMPDRQSAPEPAAPEPASIDRNAAYLSAIAEPLGTDYAAEFGRGEAGDTPFTRRDRAEYSQRVRQLDRMAKPALLHIMTTHVRASGARYVIGGPATWSKDELINGILAAEFPSGSGEAK